MIKIAHIAPIYTTHRAIESSTFNMVLAHIADESPAYCEMFKSSPLDTLLDNGAFELGYPMPADEMIRLGHKVGADILVLPDFPYEDWGRGWLTVTDEIMTYKGNGFKTLFVPQSTKDDVIGLYKSIERALENPQIDYIGLSILACPNAGLLRKEILERYKNWSAAKNRFHILGMLGTVDEITELKEYESMINSWDTSAAVWYGINDISVMGRTEKFKDAVDFDSKLEWNDYVENNICYMKGLL